MKRFGVLSISVVLLVFCMLQSSVVFADQNMYLYNSLELEQSISNEIQIIPSRSIYDVSYFDVELFLVPKESAGLTSLSSQLTPLPQEESKESILFRWDKPKVTTLRAEAKFVVKTSSEPVKITSKVSFPLQEIPLDVQEYVQFTDVINVNDNIRNVAYTLANNVDDLYALQFLFAEWVNKEITYNLTTITSDANMPSTWVYENKHGVCDEITNLFISLNRAVGIPARFVSGIAYSDLVESKWGNHGWAEVYFPGFGWVPFDVTYNQYGFVDASHIALAKNVDGSLPSVKYNAKGKGFDFEPKELVFTTNILKTSNLVGEHTSVKLFMQEPVVGFSSYNLLKVRVKNNRNYYVVEELTLSNTENVKLFQENKQKVLLAPFEEKELFWLLQVEDNLEKQYVYTFPLTITQSKQSQTKTFFKAQFHAEFFPELYMEQFMHVQENKALLLYCEAQETVLLKEEAYATCSYKGREFPVLLCLEQNCKRVVTANNNATFLLNTTTAGIHTASIIVRDVEQQSFVTYNVLDTATLAINLNKSSYDVSFGEQLDVNFIVAKTSVAKPSAVKVSVRSGLIKESWTFDTYSQDTMFNVLLDGSVLASGENDFHILVTYIDNFGDEQVLTEEITIIMTTNSLQEKMLGKLNRFSLWVNSVGSASAKALTSKDRETENKELERFMVLLITFLCLSGIIVSVKGSVFLIKKIFRKE